MSAATIRVGQPAASKDLGPGGRPVDAPVRPNDAVVDDDVGSVGVRVLDFLAESIAVFGVDVLEVTPRSLSSIPGANLRTRCSAVERLI